MSNNEILNIDSIIIQMKKKNELLFSDFSSIQFPNIQFKESKTKINKKISFKSLYQSYYSIHYNGIEIGYLLDNQLFYSDLIQIKFHKHILYSDLDRIKCFYNELISNDLIEFDNFNKLEISLNSLDSIIFKQIGHVYNNSINNYHCEKPLYDSNSKSGINIHSLDYGKEFIIQTKSKGNLRPNTPSNKIAIYLKDNLDESQIQYYNENDLNVIDHLYRLEVRLNVEFFRVLRNNKGIGFDFLQIFEIDNQKMIFDYAIGDKLKFKILGNYTYTKSRNKKYEILSLYEPELTLKSIIKPKPVNYTPMPPKLNQRAKNKLFRDSMISYNDSPNPNKLNFISDLISQVNLKSEIPKLEEKGIPIEKLHFIVAKLLN